MCSSPSVTTSKEPCGITRKRKSDTMFLFHLLLAGGICMYTLPVRRQHECRWTSICWQMSLNMPFSSKQWPKLIGLDPIQIPIHVEVSLKMKSFEQIMSKDCDIIKALFIFYFQLEANVNQGWIKSRLPVLFRTDSFKIQIDYRQFQKFLFVIDSFRPNTCGKYVLKSFRILGKR